MNEDYEYRKYMEVDLDDIESADPARADFIREYLRGTVV
jgi:hypothetical protein